MEGHIMSMWALALCVTMYAEGTEQRPNFIIMLMDDMGWGDLGSNGEPHKETPHLDQMAREGMVFTDFYTSSPLCSPSRASLLTGRLPIRNGFYTTNAHARNAYTPQNIMGGIAETEVLFPELLMTSGYRNKLVGKWHLGHQEQFLPLRHGFHEWFGSPNCHFGPYDDVSTPNIPVFRNSEMEGRYYEDYQIFHNGTSDLTYLYTLEAEKFLYDMARKQQPFLLYWAPDSTHAPVYASTTGTSLRGIYGDAVQELDEAVGFLLSVVRKSGLQNNTFVFFTSDNGAALVSKYNGGSNGPFLCGKQTTFEGGMRAPGIAYWPGHIPAGRVSHQVATQMDLFSTLLDLAGIKPPAHFIDGMSLKEAMFDSKQVDRPVFYYRGNELMAVRFGPYKMHLWTWSTPGYELEIGINYCPGAFVPNVTTSTQVDHTDNPVLFHLGKDPGERYPIRSTSQEYQLAVTKLKAIVADHKAKLIPGKPVLNWCDDSKMHWSPPGCQKLGKCLKAPPSKPYLCPWPH